MCRAARVETADIRAELMKNGRGQDHAKSCDGEGRVQVPAGIDVEEDHVRGLVRIDEREGHVRGLTRIDEGDGLVQDHAIDSDIKLLHLVLPDHHDRTQALTEATEGLQRPK